MKLRAALCSLAPLLALPAALRAQVPPNEHWMTLETPHFHVHYPRGMDDLGRRASVRAEVAYAELSQALIRPPRGKVDLVVSDNVDFSNGYATPIPSNRVVVFAHPPIDDPLLSFYDDWLQLVISHELTHVFHLDYADGPYAALRHVFGRNVVGFPELFTPSWTKEGLAVYEESRLTHAGRLLGTMHEMELRTAVLENRFFPIDRASESPATWPAGYTAYTYGSEFVQYLGTQYGDDALRRFVRIVGRRLIPYRMDAAARAAFGVTLTQAWRDWHERLKGRYAAVADSIRREGGPRPEMLTRAGYYAVFPRFSPRGEIAYAAYTGHAETATRVIGADGTDRKLAPRNSLGASAWMPDGRGLVTSQIEARDPYRDFSDLYRISGDGDVDRLTHGARIQQPDVSAAGRIVAIQGGGGTTVPVLVDAATGAVKPLAAASPDVQWGQPRWSPDGSRIALSRWRRGGFFDVVVIDTLGAVVREVTRDRAIDDVPAWSPDGRYVVFSSDRTGISDLYAYDLTADRLMRVTRLVTGAFQPDVSRDGRWIAFSWYHADGYHVARIPFDPSAWTPAPPVRAALRDSAAAPTAEGSAAAPAPHPYRPWPSLLPRAWSPVFYDQSSLGVAVGAAVGGEDVVGRHAYGISAAVRPEKGRTDVGAGYLFSGLVNPVIGLSAVQDWDVAIDPKGIAVGDTLVPTALLEREREASATLTFRRARYRSYAWLSGGASVRKLKLEWDDPTAPGARSTGFAEAPTDLGAIATAGYSTARSYAFSISPEQGFTTAVSVEGRRYARPFLDETEPAGYLRLIGRQQAYHAMALGGFARHVLAFRAAAGGDVGSRSPGLKVGGTGGVSVAGPLGTSLGLGENLAFPVRGYPSGSERGDRAFSATGEYRFPIALVERGYRLVPVALDRVWGTAFADAGAAWCVAACNTAFVREESAARPLVSVGAELSATLDLLYAGSLIVRGGVAAPLSTIRAGDGTTRERPSPSVYVRLGRSF
jgi:hypothetical protein